MRLFDRVIELTVGETAITDLDISFAIEKDEDPEPHPCHIDIYNLNPENRAILSKYKKVPVILKAGYQNHGGIIFKGDMVRVSHIKEGASWKTSLACGDGVSIQGKRTQKTYAKGTPLKTVIEDLAKEAGLSANSPMGYLEELNKAITSSLAISANPWSVLANLLAGQNLKASVQNQSLQIRKNNEPLPKEAIVLKSETGLLATPEISSHGKVFVRSLLMPEFNPGRKVYIESSILTGFITIEKVRFNGSNFSSEWEAGLEGVMVG